MTTGPLDRLLDLRLHQQDGVRSPHKPLLTLLALSQLMSTGSSLMAWSQIAERLADLLAEFGRPSTTGRAQSAAYPFTRLRSDGVWELDAEVPMDRVGPLQAHDVTGHFTAEIEVELAAHPSKALDTARALVLSHFPETLAVDVLAATGLDPDAVLRSGAALGGTARRRSPLWRNAVIEAWDRSCAFCGWDGQLGGAPVGLEAAHVRWHAYDGPDDLDNGLALCSLHHKLFDRGAIGLDEQLQIIVSSAFSSRTSAGRSTYGLHGRPLKPRPGTAAPAEVHVMWHAREVFKGIALAA